ncbi:MAG: helix-turn-helix domain-containing protein [Clostridia bacterium]|nr:helix-turn-helix domain-containing protein [Clostridia bacterium]
MEELFSKRLNELISNSNYTLDEIEKYVGKTNATISRYASGEITGVKRSTIVKLANFFNVSPSWLAGFTDEKYDIFSNKQIFPLLGKVKAGYDYLAAENIIGYVNSDNTIPDSQNCYALKVTGDSMQPVLFEDDIIIVHKQNDVENGQVAIILIDNEEATVKKVVKYEDYIELVAFNSYYPSKKLTKDSNFQIIGKVIEARISKIFE